MNEVVKEVYGTEFLPGQAEMNVLNVQTGQFERVKETGVLGRFARVQQLNGFKSREAARPVYDAEVICQIKINSAVNKDVVSHKVTGAKGEELKERFAQAWASFEILQSAAETKTAGEAARTGKGAGK